MNRLSDWIYQQTTAGIALISLVVFILFTALVLPAQNKQVETYSGGLGSPDTSFYYSAEHLYQFAEQYGPEGRSAYIRARLIFDAIFPLVYGVFLTTVLTRTLQVWAPKYSPLRRLNLLPLLGVLLDYLENASAAIVMARYPSRTDLFAHLAGFFTASKWVFIIASFVLLIVGIGKSRWSLSRRQEPPQT